MPAITEEDAYETLNMTLISHLDSPKSINEIMIDGYTL